MGTYDPGDLEEFEGSVCGRCKALQRVLNDSAQFIRLMLRTVQIDRISGAKVCI